VIEGFSSTDEMDVVDFVFGELSESSVSHEPEQIHIKGTCGIHQFLLESIVVFAIKGVWGEWYP
jgi:hypothetical protein